MPGQVQGPTAWIIHLLGLVANLTLKKMFSHFKKKKESKHTVLNGIKGIRSEIKH